ncbi:BCCT family transporter [Halopenitus persicus]|uniref:BCCT family transporter n=1 Tax=Halopenitus persicus TaxID=1048396 RepID=UPI0012FD7ADC|nr:BCCT family transporter [Halopenitus persicus]
MVSTTYALGLENSTRSEKVVFILSASFSLALAIGGILYPEIVRQTLSDLFNYVVTYFNWWFIALSLILVIFFVGLMISKYGRLRLGGEEADVEFGWFSWLSMIFTVGYSSSVLFYGVAEPIAIVNNPPDTLPTYGEPIEVVALSYMFIHDIMPGLIAWYLPFGIAFGLIAWGKGTWKISTLLEPILDRDRYSTVFSIVDLLTLIAIVGGVATGLGFISSQISSIIGMVYGIHSQLLITLVFIAIALIFLLDVMAGLENGIRNAARLAVIMNTLLIGILVVVGPKLFIAELGLDATGFWLNNMPRLMTYTGSTSTSLWSNYWTGFWWAWWAAWGIFVGSFVARVSKGRTIREVFLGLGIAPTVFLLIQHSVLAGWALHPNYINEITAAYLEQGQAAALSTLITVAPYSNLIGVLVLIAFVSYILTSLDSAVYMLAAINTGEQEPNQRNRAVWGVLLISIGIMTTYLGGGAGVLQSLSTSLALPFTVLYLVVLVSIYVVVKNRYHNNYVTISDLLDQRKATVEPVQSEGGRKDQPKPVADGEGGESK